MAKRHQLDFALIHSLREQGVKWAEIKDQTGFGGNLGNLRKQYNRWLRDQFEAAERPVGMNPALGAPYGNEQQEQVTDDEQTALLTKDQLSRITSLDDLIEFFKVDTDRWEVASYTVNKWENFSNQAGVTELYQVKAKLIRRIERDLAVARQVVADMVADAAEHAPNYYQHPVSNRLSPTFDGDPVLFELAIMDPHIGMLAWGAEVGGQNYDSSIATRDYEEAVRHLLAYAHLYPVEKILYLVGNDFLHVDGAAPSAKGIGRGGATTAGTVQDVDSRLAKMFTAARRAAVAGIDLARSIAPVDVIVVPGNHDEQQMYRLGEVLSAWYRNDGEVNVVYGPNKRKFYGYGKNAFLFTHGEEYKRQRESLPLIFATECPADLWVTSTHREIHTGHNHAAMAGAYHPTSELSETRSIRTRSLPALTASDAWHHTEGYGHRRTATALIYRRSGGLSGYHEFNL